MGYSIVQANIDDLERVQCLNFSLFKKEYDEYDPSFDLSWTMWPLWKAYFRSSILDSDACCLVARYHDTTIVWYLVGWIKKTQNPCRTLNKQAELENMYIMPDHRWQHVWSQLVSLFIEWAREHGVDNICVTASQANKEAIAFYKKQGFRDYDVTLELHL